MRKTFWQALASYDIGASQGALFDEGHQFCAPIGRSTTSLSVTVANTLKQSNPMMLTTSCGRVPRSLRPVRPPFIFTLPGKDSYGCPCGFLLGGSESYTPNRYEEKYEHTAHTGENGVNGASNSGSSSSVATAARACTCTAPQIRRYLSKISGPLLDRIDIHIEVPRLSPEELMNKRGGESSATVRRRVCAARKIQVERLRALGERSDEKNEGDGEEGGEAGETKENEGAAASCNAGLRAKELREICELDGGTKELLKAAINQFGLSGRAYDRILKVSRTIADLEAAERIEMHHVAEAINYRSFDRKLFG